jgi:hypothetical protein
LNRLVDGIHSLWKRVTTGRKDNTLPHVIPGFQKLSKIPTFTIRLPGGNADEKGRQNTWAAANSSFNIKDDGELAFQFWRQQGGTSSKSGTVQLVVQKAKGTSNLIR